jgi:hypothetical protein
VRSTPGEGHPATYAEPGAYYAAYGNDDSNRHPHLIVVVKAKQGWWASLNRKPGARRRLAHWPRNLRVYGLCQDPRCPRYDAEPRYSAHWYCGSSAGRLERVGDPHPRAGLEPCLTCIARREQFHLRGFPCWTPCELGCFGALDPRTH